MEMVCGVGYGDVGCLWKWYTGVATLGACGEGVWRVSRCSVPLEMMCGVSGDVGCLWKWSMACQVTLSDYGNGAWRVR